MAEQKNISTSPRDTIPQALITADAWNAKITELDVPKLKIDEFIEKIEAAKEAAEKAERLKIERSKAVKLRNGLEIEVWNLTKTVRNAAKATFGDPSEEASSFYKKRVAVEDR